MSEPQRIYRITFLNQGQIYEVYARQVSQGGLLGFVEVEELLFGERSQVVVDPSEERLKSEFEGVRRCYVPMHAVVRIDEVEKQGHGRILAQEGEATITPFPGALYPPGGSPKKS
jgi:hypothetical protein